MPVYQNESIVEKTEHLSGVEDLRETIGGGLETLGIRTALEQLQSMMEEDADELTGAPKGKHSCERCAYRHGRVGGYAVVCGRKVAVRRPRVRSVDGKELRLPSYDWAQDEGALTETAVRMTILGTAQRGYGDAVRTLARTPNEATVRGVSKSAVSRRFIAGTKEAVRKFLSRRLDEKRYVVLYIDGVEEGGHHVLVAMGVTEEGKKEVLGLWEGSSENSAVCRELLEDLKRRGLSTKRGVLVVIDGSKALASAVREVFGDEAHIQRCQVHKRRNVLEKLPERERDWVRRSMNAAWRSKSAVEAEVKLQALADRLEEQGRRDAAASVREGLSQTLTCLRLGVDAALLPSLTNTNPLESAFSAHERRSSSVTRWRNGGQVLRWVAAALLDAEPSFASVGPPEALRELGDLLESSLRRKRGEGEEAVGGVA